MPVWITDFDTSIDIDERRIARALRQLNLNDRRIPITDSDRAAGVALMLDLEPGEGWRSAHGLVTRDRWVPTYYLLTEYLPASGLQITVPEPTVDNADDPIDATETEQADRETARAARRRVIELNKRGSAAKIRRIEFLTELLAARTAPSGTAMFVASTLNREPGLLSSWGASTTTRKLLGVTSTDELAEKIGAAATGRAWVIMLALVLGALESQIEKDSWRRPPSGAARYLNFLAEVGTRKGFALVDVERAITTGT